jgi:D-amino-acid dehydrogenase
MSAQNTAEVAIIGAGIVGLACALRLQMDGRKVAIIDPNEPASGCSHGNAGYLAEGHIFPPAALVPLSRLPRALLDPLGPLVVRAACVPRMIPWALHAAATLRPAALPKVIDALAALNSRAIDSYELFLDAIQARDLIERKGALTVYRTVAGLDRAATRMAAIRQRGLHVERLDAAQVRALEPAFALELAGALFYPDSGRCANPRRLGQRFADTLAANGATFHRAAATRLVPQDGGGWSIETDGPQSIAARQIVISAGARSHRLLGPLGYRVPLAAECGYHLMLPRQSRVTLSRPVSSGDHFFTMTPMEEGFRLAGTAEFADVDAPMNPRRADLLLGLARRFLPALEDAGATRWMGARPSLPDGLPAIGRAHRHADLYCCFGHQHLGLTQAAISARILGDLMAGREPPLAPEPFALNRFEQQ